MDFRSNTVLKEHYTFFVGDREAMVRGGEHGLYSRDVRFLSRYAWTWTSSAPGGAQTLLVDTPRGDLLHAHHALMDGASQRVAVRRRLTLRPDGLDDRITVENSSLERCAVSLDLDLAGDFADLFEARGWHAVERPAPTVSVADGAVSLRARAADGVEQAVLVELDPLAAARPDGADWELSLAPGERLTLSVRVTLDNPLDPPPHGRLDHDTWRDGFPPPHEAPEPAVYARAVDDLRALLLFTPEGPVPAAGIPWFVAAFGRDALLTAHMLLPYRPDVAAGTLRFLARHQGRTHDAFRAEEPGKILHEIRHGELSRTGVVPHGLYYGTVDATPLFVTLVDAYRRATGDDGLVRELRPAWEAALAWIVDHGDVDGDGFVEYVPAADGRGLAVQSWKDSHDSMSHADGSLAEGAIAVSEVQGYAFAAHRAAAACYRSLGDDAAAQAQDERATALARRFHDAFWQDGLDTYAMALDGSKRPLAVLSSDAGQLLWSGIVPAEVAPRLVRTLVSDALWTGWGIRTLGSSEVRYNPLSYHNGSVWPHDTALTALGLQRYGFVGEAEMLRTALYELAAAQPDRRLPELVGGYAREEGPPVPYPVACRPQAWDAAALVALLGVGRGGPAGEGDRDATADDLSPVRAGASGGSAGPPPATVPRRAG